MIVVTIDGFDSEPEPIRIEIEGPPVKLSAGICLDFGIIVGEALTDYINEAQQHGEDA